MTEAGNQWAEEQLIAANDYNYADALQSADFWLRAFCAEVERRAETAP